MDPNIRVMIAAPEADADILYRARFWAPDPITYIEMDGKRVLIVSDLEAGRAVETAKVDEVVSSTTLGKELKEQGQEKLGLAHIVHHFLAKTQAGAEPLLMPGSTAARYVDTLRTLGHHIELGEAPFWAERRHKESYEIANIEETLRHTEAAVAAARTMIRAADARDGILYVDNEVLTSERVRSFIQVFLLKQGCSGAAPIVSCGPQAALPHELGSGPLRTNQTIILDVFPRSMETLYCADITRSLVHGVPSDAALSMHSAVADAVQIVLDGIKPGEDGKALHNQVVALFNDRGFKTTTRDGKPEGFFHGTGHGVGLEVHEQPRISEVSCILEEGDVVTVEPGLYYPDIGGIRIEELVVVEKDGCRNLCTLDWDL
jgi:Xaa-Pro aminopeptidase